MAVGGQPTRRGVVAAASYEARAFGVRSAMPMATAVRLCPSLVIVRPDFARYRAVSNAVFAIFREVTPLVEPLSLDEAYLDVTENRLGRDRSATAVAKRLKARIRDETGLTASAGVAPNKFLAKIASGWKKPDGLTVISPDRVEPFLQQLPVDALWGVGPVTARKLRAHGIERLVDIRAAEPAVAAETPSAASPTGCASLPTASTIGRSPRTAKPSLQAPRTPIAQDLTDLAAIREEVAEMAAYAAALAGPQGAAGADGHDQGPLRRLHDDDAQPHAPPTRDEAAIVDTRRPAARPHRGRRSGRSGCSASASTISATDEEADRGTTPVRDEQDLVIESSGHLTLIGIDRSIVNRAMVIQSVIR